MQSADGAAVTVGHGVSVGGGGANSASDDASLVLIGLLAAAGVLLFVLAVINVMLVRLVRQSRRRLISGDSAFQGTPPTTVALAVMTPEYSPQNAKHADPTLSS